MNVKTKAELEKLSIEDLRAYKKDLAEHKEREEILGSVEVVRNTDPVKDLAEIQVEAKKGNKNPELIKELSEINAKLTQMGKKDASTFGGLRLDKSVSKEIGDEASAVAKDLAETLPMFDAVAQMTNKRVWELNSFKKYIGVDATTFRKAVEGLERQNRVMAISKAAMDTATNVNWVPTGMDSVVMDSVLKSKAVAANLPGFDMPSNPYDWPVNGGPNTAYYVTESVTAGSVTTSATNPTSSKSTFSAKKIACRVDLSSEIEEDAAFAILPVLNRQMADAIGDGFERAVLFGDESTGSANINANTGSVTTTAGAASVYLSCDGAAFKALSSNGANLDVSGGSAASDFVRLTLQKMGEGAKDIQALRTFVPAGVYFTLLGDSTVKSLNTYGAGASILTGEVGRVYGVPVFMTGGIPLTASNGKVDGTTPGNNTYGSMIIINSNKVLLGYKRRLKVASDYFNTTDLYTLVASMRFDFQQFGSNLAGQNPIGYGFKITIA
jgi:HK97 family phage major capsid protein